MINKEKQFEPSIIEVWIRGVCLQRFDYDDKLLLQLKELVGNFNQMQQLALTVMQVLVK